MGEPTVSRCQSLVNSYPTLARAEMQLNSMKLRNPRRKFKIFKVRGARGGTSYDVCAYLTDTEYRRMGG